MKILLVDTVEYIVELHPGYIVCKSDYGFECTISNNEIHYCDYIKGFDIELQDFPHQYVNRNLEDIAYDITFWQYVFDTDDCVFM